MPLGNFAGSATRFPLPSRVFLDQQSSMFTYLYPAAAIPLDTIASAVWRISVSLTLQPKEFQSFQPNCGVRARLFSNACAGEPVPTAATTDAPTAASATTIV